MYHPPVRPPTELVACKTIEEVCKKPGDHSGDLSPLAIKAYQSGREQGQGTQGGQTGNRAAQGLVAD